MDYNEACKESCECEKCKIGKTREANIEAYDFELEEGEIWEDEPPRSESPIHKDMSASPIELSSSAQEAVEKEQVNIRQSTSPERASHQGGTRSTVVVQQTKYSATHKDMAASAVELSSSAKEAVEKEQINTRQSTTPERGSLQGGTTSMYSAIHKDLLANSIELSTSAQGVVEEKQLNIRQSTSPKSGSYQGGTASTSVVQQSIYSASEGRHVNVRQSTLPRTCSGKHGQSYSPSVYSTSKERHKQRKQGCFKYSDYRWVLKKIEEVCSARFNKLLLQQNGDCKKFKILRKKHESEFFQEHAHSYKVHYAHVMPTIRYYRMKLPKLHLSILRERFHKHMQSQLIKFVKQQINDRNNENRRKARWIFEAEAGYLKKCFYDISLSYSEFNLEKLEWHMTDSSDGEEQLKYFNMQSLTTQIEAIASNREPEDTFADKASDVSAPILENSPSLLETNGATKLGFSVGVAEEMAILESRSSQFICASTMEFGENDGTQIAFSAAAQNEGGNVERPCATQSVMSAASELAKAMTASDVSELILENSPLLVETSGATKLGFSVGVAEEMATIESSSSQSACAPTMEFGEKDGAQIAFSAATQNEGENMDTPCASWSVTSAALELATAVTTDSENAPPIFREKRKRISSDNDVSEGHCSRSQRKFSYESASNLCRTASHHEEPPAARPPSVNINQMMQAEDTGSKEVLSGQTSCFARVTEQSNMHYNTQSVTHQRHCDSTCQTASHPYQPPAGNTRSVRTGVDSLEASNVQPASANQVPTGSTPEQYLAEDGNQSIPFTIELSRLLMLRDLITKRHKEKREQLILAREIELAQAKRKYDELIYNSEIEVLQKKRDLKIICDKIYKQQILAEGFQVIFKASAGVIPDSPRGAAQRTMTEPNRLSDQQVFQFPASVPAPTSASMYQSMQSSVQPSTDASLRQHNATTQHTAMDYLGRSTTTLMHNSSGGMGNGLAYNRQAPHLRAFANQLPASGLHLGVASLEK